MSENYTPPDKAIESAIVEMIGYDSAGPHNIALRAMRALHESGFAVVYVRWVIAADAGASPEKT